jgi:uncharacterized protein (TIGR02996 family)
VSKGPRDHAIDIGSEPVRCATCEKRIAADTPRFAEAVVSDDGSWARTLRYARNRKRSMEFDCDGPEPEPGPNPDMVARYHHLECAATKLPGRLGPTLNNCRVELANRDELLEMIGKALSPKLEDPAAENLETSAEYRRFIERAREDYDETLLVFADWLQQVGDPRGQLAAVQHSMETVTGMRRDHLVESEQKLMAAHRRAFVPPGATKLVWRRGFVHRAEYLDDPRHAEGALAHPSLAVVQELALTANLEAVPPWLRVLELDLCFDAQIPAFAGLSRLERLRLPMKCTLELFEHATLGELVLEDEDAEHTRLRELSRDRLPALRRVEVRAQQNLDFAVAALVGSGFVDRLHTLVLHGDLTSASIAQMREAKLRVEVLDVLGTPLGIAELPQLESLATTVHVTRPVEKKPPGPWMVRHTKRPEWGVGRVLAETDDGLRVAFDSAGEKLIRTPDLLEDVD